MSDAGALPASWTGDDSGLSIRSRVSSMTASTAATGPASVGRADGEWTTIPLSVLRSSPPPFLQLESSSDSSQRTAVSLGDRTKDLLLRLLPVSLSSTVRTELLELLRISKDSSKFSTDWIRLEEEVVEEDELLDVGVVLLTRSAARL